MTRRPSRTANLRIAILGLAFLFTATCTGDRESPLSPGTTAGPYVTPTGLVTSNPPQIFIGAGDMASCSNNDDEATAEIIDTIPGTVYTLGDNVYPNGTDSEFADCYDPTWGRFKARTKPSAGNHDYNTNGAAGYYRYFGAAAGDPSKGYYSFDLGAWHIIVLNSNITRSAGSPQDDWLIADLAAHPNQCTLAYFHHPLYSSTGGTGSGGATYSSVRRFWDDLYAAGADLVLGGHRHFYERLAPTKPDGTRDDANGIREIIAGSGGIGGGSVTNVFPTSEVRNGDTRGVLKLYLYDDSYAWKFIPVAGKTFTDSGSTACHASGGSGGGGGSTVSPGLSTVSAAPVSIAAGPATSTITVTAKDSNGDPVAGVAVTLSATGSGNTLVQPADPTNASGVATGTIRSTVAEEKTISATADGVALTQTATLTVTPGPVSASQSTVTASPTSITAGSGSAAITVTAKDANGNLISGATVTLAATGSGNTLVQPADTTDASGVATGSFSSTVAEPKTISATIDGTAVSQTASVMVNPPGVTGTISHTLLDVGNNSSNGKVYTTASISPVPNALVTVAVLSRRSGGSITPTVSGGGMSTWDEVASEDFDTQGSPHRRLTIFRAMSSAPGSGPITIQYQSSVSNAQWIVSQWQGVETSGTNGAGAIVQVGGTASDGATSLTVPLAPFADANDVAFAIAGVTDNGPAISPGAGFTEIAEQSSTEKSSLAAEWATNQNTVSASWASVLESGLLSVEIRAGGSGGSGTPSVSASQSTVSASPTTIAAGSGTATITVTAMDAGGNPVSGATVVLAATGSGNTLTQPAAPTDANGVATGSLTSTVAEPKSISATAGGVAISQTTAVTVAPGPVSSAVSTLTASPTSIQAGTETATITVTARDAQGNAISGATVVLAATGGGNTLTQPAGPTDANGVATGTLASSVAEDKTVSATIDGTGVSQTAVVTVTAAAGSGVSASLSSVAAAPGSIVAGTGSATITVTVRDGTGTPMSGVNVSLAATGSGNTLTQPSTPTDANGVASGTLSSTVAENKTVTATADAVTLSQQPVVSVTAGTVDADQSSVAASPTSIEAGTGSATITVTTRDAYGNPVGGANVSLATSGTNYALTQPAAPTDATGVATGSLSSTDVQTLVVSASAAGTALTQTASVDVTAPPPVTAISHTLLTSGMDPTNTKVYTTASIAPAPNTLVLVAVLGHRAYGAPPPPTIAGGGLTAWDEVATVTFDTQGTPLKRLTIYRAMSTSPGSGPITITFSATVSNAEWVVSQYSGVDVSGTNGSGAIAQTASAVGDGVTGLTVPLAAFANANDVAYGAFGVVSSDPAVTAGAGFATIAEVPSGETPADLFTEWATNDPTIDASWNALNGGALGVEIRAGTGP